MENINNININEMAIPWYDEQHTKSYLYDDILITNLSNILNNNIYNKINNLKSIYVDKLKEIYETNIFNNNNHYSLNLLHTEAELINILTKYIVHKKNSNIDIILIGLSYLYKISELLRNQIGQKIFIKCNTTNTIYRSSYKFCIYKHECTFNYNTQNKNTCYQDHYVHNLVSSDISIIIDYLYNNYSDIITYKNNNDYNILYNNELLDNFTLNNNDIIKTINTLQFVINHMETELKNKCMYLPKSSWNAQHFIKIK